MKKVTSQDLQEIADAVQVAVEKWMSHTQQGLASVYEENRVAQAWRDYYKKFDAAHYSREQGDLQRLEEAKLNYIELVNRLVQEPVP